MNTVPCAVVGIDPKAGFDYEHFFQHYADGRYSLTGKPSQAAILLLDMDSPEGWALAAAQQRDSNPEQQLILLVSPGNPPAQGLFLEKPACPGVLKERLEQARALLPAHHPALLQRPAPTLPTAAHRPPPPREHGAPRHGQPPRAEFSRHLYPALHASAPAVQEGFDPAQHLLGALLQAWYIARQRGQMVEVRWQLSHVRLCPLERRIHTGLRDGALRSLALTRFSGSIHVLHGDEAVWPENAYTEPVEEVLWRLAVWTSRGRLPRGITPATRVRLDTLPDLQRLLPIPHAAEIAALWSRHTCTLEGSARLLNIPATDVHLFFCATRTLELLRLRPGTAASGATPAQACASTFTSCAAASA